ncbi:MAG: hypothetical protein A2977_00120 [Alphaproteobacteria bacterium RIFCSPLOWO2_01_FULL_45_8]|nr:MAG: hypothetical protein A2065_00970 [Alphaproteobacteria bacterium GWB1_45_5]OFW76155.1 MAG: hypothetical protein A3K20_02920 [Alphaproteobacteria bacterium GWA1_45_9]OFW89555.1 MAG: hypothetical protein A2621_01380 [Alphaproteobacteria bacterium RIFCSPHIGHO2_01_FULL_41_14]OFW96451.1 MAG: hypothetical protein A2977_00120 [Alphaproteobacteria bacterium RIFCSPLOWO2_01_FULL_45_8]HCI48482.1 hypothetical protein [Holosporales bacterium]
MKAVPWICATALITCLSLPSLQAAGGEANEEKLQQKPATHLLPRGDDKTQRKLIRSRIPTGERFKEFLAYLNERGVLQPYRDSGFDRTKITSHIVLFEIAQAIWVFQQQARTLNTFGS